MQLSHAPAKTHAVFDDEHLVTHAGLVPAMRLAQQCDLAGLAGEHLTVTHRLGVNAPGKIGSIVAGMLAGADSLDDLDVLRHGGMDKLFDGIRAPSTLGSFLRCLSWGHVRQLQKIHRILTTRLATQTPLLPGADILAFVDLDSMQKRTYGATKQGAGFGHAKVHGKNVWVRGLNVLASTVSTPLAAPVLTGTRLRGGTANSARGAASLLVESIGTARQAGCTGILIARGDSAFYSASVVTACRRHQVRFSITAGMDPKITAAIAGIPDTAWTPIRYPQAVFDEDTGQWISDAEVAETEYTAFASKPTQAVTARLLVRRVTRLQGQATEGPPDLGGYRYHAVFTDNPFGLVQAEEQHRDHASIEQVFADLLAGPLAHLPSGVFAANAAWLTCAAIAHNLLRALGCLAGGLQATARVATLRRHLITVAARLARQGRGHLTLHLPDHWPWQQAWQRAFNAVHRVSPARVP